jgi:hypothetical protein
MQNTALCFEEMKRIERFHHVITSEIFWIEEKTKCEWGSKQARAGGKAELR